MWIALLVFGIATMTLAAVLSRSFIAETMESVSEASTKYPATGVKCSLFLFGLLTALGAMTQIM